MSLSPRILAITLFFAAATMLLGGCAGGKLAMRSSDQAGVELIGNFSTAVYSYDNKNNLDVLLVDGDVNNPSQVVHVRMYWRPYAGRTPIDERSTNATINYIIFTGKSAGVYSGAGFLFPQNTPGGSSFTASLRDTAVRLLDASTNFRDRLGAAIATGSFSAHRDDSQTQRLIHEIQVHLRKQLGYPRFVMAQ